MYEKYQKKLESLLETKLEKTKKVDLALNEDIKNLGIDKFKFNILKYCNSKFELSYFEAKIQFARDVLLDENYYNGIINCRIGKAPRLFLEQYYNNNNDV